MKFFKKGLVLSLVLIALVVTLTSCSGKKKVSLSAEKSEISVIIGENVDLKLSATEVKKYTEQDILANLDIKSSDEKIVKVEADKLTAVGIGTANVTATWKEYEGATVTVKVNVLAPEVGTVTYTELPANVYIGDKFSITHQAASDVTVTYETSNADVLSVNGNQFEAKAAGSAKITATATNGYKEVKKEWNVEVQQGEYTITYVLNGGKNASSNPTKYNVRTLPLALAAATKANKTFLGWSLTEGSTEYVTELAAGTQGDVTLYANFADIKHEITYELDGGTLGANSPVEFVQGEEKALVNPTKEGYTFLGWSTLKDSTEYITKIDSSFNKDIKLYANWRESKVFHKIIYNLNGGKNPEDAPTEYEQGVGVKLPIPFKEGYIFVGWTKELQSVSFISAICEYSIGEVELYAHWMKVEERYAIVYELNGGTNAEKAATEYNVGKVYVLPIPTKVGYEFLGWTLEKNSKEYIKEISDTSTGDITVYAQWREPSLIVDGTEGAGHYKTLASALAIAVDGDVITLVAGTYAENVTISIPNITIKGPNAGVAGFATRVEEAVITGVLTVKDSAKNLKIDGIKFTGAAQITGKSGDYEGFNFKNNLIVDSTLVPANYQATTNYIDSGFIQFSYSAVNFASNFSFSNNKFENVAAENIHLCKNINLSVDNNEFYNFKRDCIRIDGVYVSGVLSFTNNKFENPEVGTGQNGVYFKNYSGKSGTQTVINFKANTFIKCGGLDKTQPNSGAIGAWSYQEHGGIITIEDNIFDHCYNGIYFRNNGQAYSDGPWSCDIKNNIFLGLPTNFYYHSYNGTSDTESTNPHLAVFGANYYEDNSGQVISDLTTIQQLFKHYKSYGTALTSKPTISKADPLTYYYVTYELNGGTYNAANLVMSGYELELKTPIREGWSFLGWSLEPNSTDYIEVISKEQKEDITLYANWVKINAFLVTYDLDGGVSNELYLKLGTPAATLQVNNYNYNEGAFWSGTNYANYVFLGESTYDPKATFSDRIYIGKDSVTGLWVVVDVIQSGPSSWPEGAEYVLTISSSHNNKATLHSIVATSVKVGQVVAFSCDPTKMNKDNPGNVNFYNEAPTESKLTISVTTSDKLISPSKLGSRFEGWFDENGKKYETILDLDGDVELKAKWTELTPVTDMQVDAMTVEMTTGDTFQIIASVRPTNAYFQDVFYESSDSDIISVSDEGLMTATNAGTCTITISDYMGHAVKTYTVNVYSIASIEVDFEDEFDGILNVNEKVQIHAHSIGKNSENSIIAYSTSDASIATVDTDGYVTALKEGVVIITVSDNTGSNYQVKVQLIVAKLSEETKVDQVIKLIADYNFAIVDAGNVCLYNDGTQRYYDSMYGSVNYFLFDEYIIDEQYYAMSDPITNGSNHKERREGIDTVEFVTVHDTATLTGTVHSIAPSMATGVTSIHYTTGNGEILGVVREKYRAHHAGDSTSYSFSWLETGVKAGDNDPEFDMVKEGTIWYLTINGQKTNIQIPISNGSKTIANPSKEHFTTLGPSYKVVDGYIYVAPLRVDFSERVAGVVGNYGGNNNSIGIEMCVNVSSDVYDTWQRTGQLVADILIRHGLGLDRVKEHNTWSGKNCPQSIRAGQYWNEFMKMVEINYILMKDYKDVETSMKSNNPEIVDNTGRVFNPPKTTTTVSYEVTVKVGETSKTITLYSVIPGSTSWTQWDGSYSSSVVWNNGKFGKVF